MTDADPITSPQKLATACGVCRSTIDQWRRKPDMPGGKRGPWDPVRVMAWREQRRKPTKRKHATTYQQRERFIVSQLIAAVLATNRITEADSIEAFWTWYDALPDPPLKGAGYGAGMWIRQQLKSRGTGRNTTAGTEVRDQTDGQG